MNYLSFFIDFSVTALCFAGCFIAATVIRYLFSVLGLKFILSSAIKFFFPKKQPAPVKKRRRKKPAPVRSIEIDPEEVDRIYVRKIS